MAPLQTLKWVVSKGPSVQDVEIEGTEPYVVGGHTASGYWVNSNRMTTIPGLFAAGDVAGGAPQKYVTGALAEGEIAAEGIIDYIQTEWSADEDVEQTGKQVQTGKKEYESYLTGNGKLKGRLSYKIRDLETAMQKAMDEYAGGIKTGYRYTLHGLEAANERIFDLTGMLAYADVKDMYDLLELYELRERLVVARTLIAHLKARKETRWHGFQENADYPEMNAEFECYINSVMRDGEIKIIKRELIMEL